MFCLYRLLPTPANKLDVIPAQAGIHPEMPELALDAEISQDGPRLLPGDTV